MPLRLLSLLSCILLHGFPGAAQCWPTGIFSNSSASTPASKPACTNDRRWLAPGKFSAEGYSDACNAALRGLLSVYHTDDKHYAFMASGAHSASIFPHVQTPITYKSSKGFVSCTVAVALFIDLPVEWLPYAPRGPYLGSAVSTWGAIEEAGYWVIFQCLMGAFEPLPPKSAFGWMATPSNHLGKWSCFVLDLQLVCLLRFMLIFVSVRLSSRRAWGFLFCYLFGHKLGDSGQEAD